MYYCHLTFSYVNGTRPMQSDFVLTIITTLCNGPSYACLSLSRIKVAARDGLGYQNWLFPTISRFDSEKAGDREVQRTMLELLNQLDGFQPNTQVKVMLPLVRTMTRDTGSWYQRMTLEIILMREVLVDLAKGSSVCTIPMWSPLSRWLLQPIVWIS